MFDSAHAKLGRARGHVEALRSDIYAFGEGNRYVLPTRLDSTPDGGAELVIADVPTHDREWGLLIGDAIQNFRSTLDHAWWELAVRHLKRTPTEAEARQIQFPINKPGSKWDARRYRPWVGADVTSFVKELQPDETLEEARNFHPLEALRVLSNQDKHRFITVTVNTYEQMDFEVRAGDGYETPGESALIGEFKKIEQPAEPGKVVLTIPPESALFREGVTWTATLTGFVAVAKRRDVLEVLEFIDDWITKTLEGLEAIANGKRNLVVRKRQSTRSP